MIHVKMTVGGLKKMLEGLDDSMIVVTEGSDHSYNYSDAVVTEAWMCLDKPNRGHLYEYYGAEYAGEGEGQVVKVLRIL